MNVQLYVYDLSRGMARNMSAAFLGIQIEAIYHTAVVMEGIEYLYDGGIKTARPGMTHLGAPMRVVELGKTELPMDVIMDYLESLREIYTAQAYDLWTHNCNNFSNDFCTFLLGKGIPEYITNLPQTVLDTPFGRMLQPQINDMVNSQKAKHGGNGGLLGIGGDAPKTNQQIAHSVRKPISVLELEGLLMEANKSCAVIFFTSASCKPCKALYPAYDELAAEVAHKATLIMVDISSYYEIGTKYNIRATPTFMTFLHGNEENRWSGADARTLKLNVRTLVQSAWPPHLHQSLQLPALRRANTKPVLYSKVPPLAKLKTKMGESADDAAVAGIMKFISHRQISGAAEATLPDLDAFSWFLRSASSKLPPEIMFTIVDLLRIALVDPRLSGYYAEEKDHKTVAPLLGYVNGLKDCPYSLRLVALQTACNLFSSPLYPQHILGCSTLTTPIVELITTSLLDDKHHNVRVAAASLSFNIAVANSRVREEEHREGLPDGDQVELAASLLESIGAEEESAEALKGFLLAFGYLVYCAPKDGELCDLLKSMDAQSTVLEKAKQFPKEPLVNEISTELLGNGLY
ncbi:Desumoylating isopeptidase 1 [Hyphodiscus hymeniophilus]|uniref:Desumoylating isopeptidase 1 n=1 Tax=Hyphodiscus hymeniophilus TaxID=353542 RepID=A0A9P6VIM1_9HELO|nr:Desumoylating isopeptidase 1 [Hyphodiscus hymeniophilus]